MKNSKNNLALFIIGALLLALGALGGGWWAKRAAMSDQATAGMAEKAAPKEKDKVLYWYDPMYPQQHFDKPGKSPFMDMQLVPKVADEGAAGAGVKIDPDVLQNLGTRLAAVTRIPLSTQIEVTGIVGYNERDVAVVQNRVAGFVEHTWPLAPGDIVKAGQPLVEFLVPEWAAGQYELLALRSTKDASLLAAARDRLRLMGMPENLIREVEKSGTARTRYTVSAPIGGLLQSLDVRPGMTVMAGQTLARINGLSTVWLDAAVPQAMAADVRTGGSAQVRIDGFPGEPISGRITAILPMLSDASRSLRVRVELPNRDGRLRPGLSAQVILAHTDQATALSVPTEAVIRTGKRALVMVAGDAGRFIPVEVTLGREVNERTVILAGLEEGQQVVSSGQFLIDSEASLSGIMARTAGDTGTKSEPAPAGLHEADATIKEIGKDNITLAHGPFPTLSMPSMTMAYPLAKPELVKGLKVGDKVRVGVRETDDGLIVEQLTKTGGNP
jgi:Cu(I)/Ag(I) efflux system membrane fusion protein